MIRFWWWKVGGQGHCDLRSVMSLPPILVNMVEYYRPVLFPICHNHSLVLNHGLIRLWWSTQTVISVLRTLNDFFVYTKPIFSKTSSPASEIINFPFSQGLLGNCDFISPLCFDGNQTVWNFNWDAAGVEKGFFSGDAPLRFMNA